MHKLLSLLILFYLSLIAIPGVGFAAGSNVDYSSNLNMPADYLSAVKLIKMGDYQSAMPLLKSAEKNKLSDSDIQNLFGFTNRKLGNFDKAGIFYRKALQINKNHKGALEYQGELFLMLGDVAAAKANLQKLGEVCIFGCDELNDLRTAIRNYKS